MIDDRSTNMVYISKHLEVELPGFCRRFTSLMDKMDIHWRYLNYTNDIWARDYMPLQIGKHDFLKYKYRPDYLLNDKKSVKYITDCDRTCRNIGIICRETSTVIDGGNVVKCGDYAVMTDKVFTENGKEKYDKDFARLLEKELKRKIIFIPWHCIEPNNPYADVYGHADGFIKWCGNNKVLMSNHRNTDKQKAEEIKRRIEQHGFDVTEMLFDVPYPDADWNWAYINFLQVGNKIIMPSFGIAEDKQAYNYIKDAFPNCDVVQLRSRDLAARSGALHCITWNIKV